MQDDKAPALGRDLSATGRVLAGRYTVGQLLRSGGMGSVYEGEHTATGRRVALKLVHLRAPMLSELEHRFEREARIASNVQSKHIVQVFDAGRDEVLGPFIAMELLKGEDLEDRLARTGALPVRTACEIAFQAARGLERAHAANIAHRDLKPGNLFLVDSDDEEEFLVKVLDFGIAKLFDDFDSAGAKLTREGISLGTPQYMSPEQARGREDIDARTDVYSLGAVLYEMLVGRSHVPALANYNQLVIHIATEPAPRISKALPDVDPRLDRLVAEMLVGDRRDRLQTMRMVRERLAPILGIAARPGSCGRHLGVVPGRARGLLKRRDIERADPRRGAERERLRRSRRRRQRGGPLLPRQRFPGAGGLALRSRFRDAGRGAPRLAGRRGGRALRPGQPPASRRPRRSVEQQRTSPSTTLGRRRRRAGLSHSRPLSRPFPRAPAGSSHPRAGARGIAHRAWLLAAACVAAACRGQLGSVQIVRSRDDAPRARARRPAPPPRPRRSPPASASIPPLVPVPALGADAAVVPAKPRD